MKRLISFFLLLLCVSAHAETLTIQNRSGDQALLIHDYKFFIEAGQMLTMERTSDTLDILLHYGTPNESNSALSLQPGDRLITLGASDILDQEYTTPTNAFWMGFQTAALFGSFMILVRIVNLIRIIPTES